jgi:predicted nucleic acid-binding Zn ribbon protein
MRFVDYKCNDCENVCEVVMLGSNGNSETDIKCEKCGSFDMLRIFAPISFKASGGDGSDYEPSSSSSSSKSCSGGSCSSCSGGCNH